MQLREGLVEGGFSVSKIGNFTLKDNTKKTVQWKFDTQMDALIAKQLYQYQKKKHLPNSIRKKNLPNKLNVINIILLQRLKSIEKGFSK